MRFFVLDRKYSFWPTLDQKIKIVTLSRNLVPRLIQICRIQWWCSLFPFFDQKYAFWANLVQKIKIVSLTWNLVHSLIMWICRIQWWLSFYFSVLDQIYPLYTLYRIYPGQICSKKLKFLDLSWNLVPRLIQKCKFQWWCSFYLFYTGSTLFGQIWFKNQNFQFKLKFCTKFNSNIQNWMVIFICFFLIILFYFVYSFACLRPEKPFSGKFGSKNQNCQFKLKFGT